MPEKVFTVEEVNAMTLEIMLGKPRKVHGPEADKFRRKLKKQIDEIKAEGKQVMMTEE